MTHTYPKSGYAGKHHYPKPVGDYPIAAWQDAAMVDEQYWERVKARMAEHNVSQTKLAQVLGLPSQSAISNLFLGKRRLQLKEKVELESYLRLAPERNISEVPIIGLTSAGSWREAIEMPLGRMAILSGVAGEKAFAVEVKGDSMDLLIEEGGYVVVDPDKTALYDGSVYLIENAEHETMVKRYRANPARFTPMSRNEEHEEFPVGLYAFSVIGKVVWKGGKV